MFRLLTSTVGVLALTTSLSLAQEAVATNQDATAKTDTGEAATANSSDQSAEVTTDLQITLPFFGSFTVGEANASVGVDSSASSTGNGIGLSNIGSVTIDENAANTLGTFQVGNDNNSLTQQVGQAQSAATLQIGDDNIGVISQQDFANLGSLSQVGDDNVGAIIQEENGNGAALAQLGDGNQAVALQTGGIPGEEGADTGNFSAIAQNGEANTSVTFQDGLDNAVASVQFGDDNLAFVSQGGGVSEGLTAIDGISTFDGSLPENVAITGTGIGAQGATSNVAAVLQIGDANATGIIQTGTGNQAIALQNSN